MPARIRVGLSATLSLALVGALGLGLESAAADETVPSAEQVAQAERDTAAAARDVADVRADLIAAQVRADNAWISAAQAAEAYNGATWRARQARKQARAARIESAQAQAGAERERAAYSRSLVAEYQSAGSAGSLTGLLEADGIESLNRTSAAWQNMNTALDQRYQRYQATSVLADTARKRADEARTEAVQAKTEAQSAHAAATSAAAAAQGEADSMERRRGELLAELARLQGVSLALATQRQEALEQEAAAAAAAAAAAETDDEQTEDVAPPAAETETDPPESDPVRPPATQPSASPTRQPDSRPTSQPSQQPTSQPSSQPSQEPSSAGPTTGPTTAVVDPAPTAPVIPATPPAPSAGASAAIAFAKAQLGEPYVWGAAGPNSWDCSGLIMKAWAAGGKSLPHWSVGQYQASTPIRAGQLRPGDLVFWGSSSSPSSIYHVAMYLGDGQIIHAPRTGRPVGIESMYYWRTPNFYARP